MPEPGCSIPGGWISDIVLDKKVKLSGKNENETRITRIYRIYLIK
jgi:hypothetical protein